MQFFKDIFEFLKSLTFIDYIFFFAIIVLLILIVTLIYFIKINDEVFLNKKDKENLETTKEMAIVKEITKNMVNKEPKTVSFTDYEKDQEEKAIISYDELLKHDNNYEINYEKEEVYDDLKVKKIDLDHLIMDKEENPKPNFAGRAISFQKEEAFLQALKRLQNGLN